MLRSRKGEDDIAALLTAWLYTPEAGKSADEISLMRTFENSSDEMIANIYQMLTERQKEKLQKSILKYIATFQELASH